ncbi:MAG TPA: hypothetical protein VN934_08380 [Candidatus Tumulicola sp.]|nr:hypothetical protein [Candidatus Tumulicola sp.]
MKFRLGVNYWPASSAMYWWRRFDRAEVVRDFARIRAAGFDNVRIFLLWEDFQPQAGLASPAALESLLTVADAASAEGLSLVPTLFTGHMSGANWLPAWAIEPGSPAGRFRIVSGGRVVDGKPRSWFDDAGVVEAQVLLAREVAASLRAHPALWAYDLGNENSNCSIPATRESGIAWLEAVSGAIRAADPVHPITIGLHMEDLEENRRLGPAEAAQACDFLCMHGYPIYASWASGATDALLLPFLTLITGWLGRQEVLFEEFGAPTEGPGTPHAAVPLLSERAAARYTREALKQLRRFGSTGAVVWCYADYDRSLWTVPPLDEVAHERSFGLWRSDGSEKPALRSIGDARDWTRVQTTIDLSWIDIPREEFYDAPLANLKRLYGRFRERYRRM